MVFTPGGPSSSSKASGFTPGGAVKKKAVSPSSDLGTLPGLQAYAKSKGVEDVQKEKKLSFLQRLGRGLSALEPADAFYKANYEGKNFVTTYLKDVFQEAGSAVTGKELRSEPKKTFKDILVKEGMKDREGKIDLVDVAGLAGDLLTDPSTYFGGAIVKGGKKLLGGAGKVVKAVGEKVAPKATAVAGLAFDAAKDSLGRAFVHGYKTTKGLSDDVTEYMNKIGNVNSTVGKKYAEMFSKLDKEAKDDLVEGMFNLRKQFGSKREQLIKDGASFEDATKQLVKEFDQVTPDKMFKNKDTIKFYANTLHPELQALKKKTAAKMFGETKAVEDVAEGAAKPVLKETAEQTAGDVGEDMLMSHYFPFIKKETSRDFASALRVSNEGYTKRFKGLLDKDEIISDAPEAYARRAAQMEKDGVTREALNKWVEQYGKPMSAFKNADEALSQGYKVIKEKGMFGKEIGYLAKDDHRFINEIFDPSFKVVDDIAKATGFDAITNLFKKSVTGLFAPFHVRNYASGILQNFEVLGGQALRPDNIALGQKLAIRALKSSDDLSGTVKLGGQDFPVKELVEAFRNRFGISSQYISDFGVEAQQALLKTPSKLNIFEHARTVGNYIETQQKMTAYVTAIRKGHDIPEALKLAENAGFDYSRLTPFEKHIMRRLIPFYAFTRKNLELQLNTLAKNPARLGTLLKTGRAAGTPQGIDTGETQMPDWMRNSFVASLGKNKFGMPEVIAGFGSPLEAAAQIGEKGLMGILATLNPLLKVPLEKATGKDFFRETDLKDVYNAEEYSDMPDFLKDFLKIKEVQKTVYRNNKPTSEKRTTYVGDPGRLHVARNLFTSRGVNYLYTLFGNDELTDKAKILKSVTGFRPYTVDEEATKYFEDRNNYRELTDLLKRLGLVREFEKTILPPEAKPPKKKKGSSNKAFSPGT